MSVFLHQYFDLGLMRDSAGDVLNGFWLTLELSLISIVFALVWGLALALIRVSRSRALAPLRVAAIAYVDAFRGIPLLLVVLLISGSLPFLTFLPSVLRSPHLLGQEDVFWFGVMALTITYGAYLAEVYRAGLQAVPRGQAEAARSLGMSHRQSMRHVVIPQAVRTVVPPMLNDFIALMKDTSLVQVIGVSEVVRVGREVQGENFNSSALTLGALLFLVVTIPLARFVDHRMKASGVAMHRGLA